MASNGRAVKLLVQHRKWLWPLVWLLGGVVGIVVFQLPAPGAVIVGTIPAAIYVVLAFTLPWHIPHQFSLRQLCIAVAVASPILAAGVQLPYLWVDYHHHCLMRHGSVEQYRTMVDNAFYGLAGNPDYAAAIAVERLAERDALTARETFLEVKTLQHFGMAARALDPLLVVVRDPNEEFAVRLQAIRTLDANFWQDPSVRDELVAQTLGWIEDPSGALDSRQQAAEVMQDLHVFQQVEFGLLRRLTRSAITGDDEAIRSRLTTLLPRPMDHETQGKLLRLLVSIAVESNDAEHRLRAREIVVLLGREAATRNRVGSIVRARLPRLAVGLPAEREQALLDLAVQCDAFDAIPRLETLMLSDSVVVDEARWLARINAMHTLVMTKIEISSARTLSTDIRPLERVADVHPHAERRLCEAVFDALDGRHMAIEIEELARLVGIVADKTTDWHQSWRVARLARERNDESLIAPLLQLSLQSKNSEMRMATASAGMELMRIHDKYDDETRGLLYETLIQLADSPQRLELLYRLGKDSVAANHRDRRFLLMALESSATEGAVGQAMSCTKAVTARSTAEQGLPPHYLQVTEDRDPTVERFADALLQSHRTASDVLAPLAGLAVELQAESRRLASQGSAITGPAGEEFGRYVGGMEYDANKVDAFVEILRREHRGDLTGSNRFRRPEQLPRLLKWYDDRRTYVVRLLGDRYRPNARQIDISEEDLAAVLTWWKLHQAVTLYAPAGRESE